MLEAVLAVTIGAADGGIFESINESLADEVRALLGVVDVGFFWRGAVFLLDVAVAPARPFTCARAFVGNFASVIEAESTSAGFTAEWEEV